jgi:hypothetical protein
MGLCDCSTLQRRNLQRCAPRPFASVSICESVERRNDDGFRFLPLRSLVILYEGAGSW